MKYCCELFKIQMESDCSAHPDPRLCPDVLVVKSKVGYGIPIRDGGSAIVMIFYCPWCGVDLAKFYFDNR